MNKETNDRLTCYSAVIVQVVFSGCDFQTIGLRSFHDGEPRPVKLQTIINGVANHRIFLQRIRDYFLHTLKQH